MPLHKLGKALGVTLFDRSRSSVMPTDVGSILAEQARLVLRETMRLTDLCDTAAGLVTGELRLGVIATLAPYLLPRVVEILAQRHPDLELVAEERVTESILDGLRSDTLDAALVAIIREVATEAMENMPQPSTRPSRARAGTRAGARAKD